MKSTSKMPRHVAIVMDGNGRFAKKRFMPRAFGHRAGVAAVKKAIEFSSNNNIEVLSLFALSVENYQSRPSAEVQFLTALLSEALLDNLDGMHKNNIRIRVMGDLSVFEPALQEQYQQAQDHTKNNTGLTLVLAIHYGGRWDILQASKKFARYVLDNELNPSELSEKDFSQFLCLSDLPEPDLFIRTSGEQRISNFMLWQFAYTELFFTDVFWPDFNEEIYRAAIAAFQKRERRFGLTGEQIAHADV